MISKIYILEYDHKVSYGVGGKGKNPNIIEYRQDILYDEYEIFASKNNMMLKYYQLQNDNRYFNIRISYSQVNQIYF